MLERRKLNILLASLILVLLTAGVFSQVRHFDFLNLDDRDYVTSNEMVKDGLTLENIKWAFTTNHISNWHPLTWIALMTEYHFFGPNPLVFHVTNALIHLLNTILLFYLFLIMTQTILGSFFIAAIFAIHPMHIESVAWVVEIKDVLSTFFILLSILAYVKYVKRKKPFFYGIALLLFAFSLMAKQMYVTLPFILLCFDFWPLQRSKSTIPSAGVLREKLPFFLLAFCASLMTLHATSQVWERLPLQARIDNALFGYVEYIKQFFWPNKVSAFYPYYNNTVSFLSFSAKALPLICITALGLKLSKAKPYFITGWFLFLVSLLPVIGLLQVGFQSMASRYTYFPYIGLSIILCYGLLDMRPKWKWRNLLITLLIFSITAALAIRTSHELKYWKNSITLFKRAAELLKKNSQASYILGLAYYKEKEYDEAEKYLNEALENSPDLPNARMALGSIYLARKDYENAIGTFRKLTAVNPDTAYHNLGIAYLQMGDFYEAITNFEKAIINNPNLAESYVALSKCYLKTCNIEKAILHTRRALEINPDYAAAKEILESIQSMGDTLEKQKEHCKTMQTIEKLKPISQLAKLPKHVQRIPKVYNIPRL